MYQENLKKIRQYLQLSMAKFADKLDIPAPTLTCYERGERTPSAQLFIQLHNKININLNWFVSGKGEMFNKSENDCSSLKEEVLYEVRQMLKKEGLIK